MTGAQAPAPCSREDSESCRDSRVISVCALFTAVIHFVLRKVDRHPIMEDFSCNLYGFERDAFLNCTRGENSS